MPNMEPQDLPIKRRSAKSPVCGSNACVEAKDVDGAILVTSTVMGNEGYVQYTYDEWNGFLDEVKEGGWDHTYRR